MLLILARVRAQQATWISSDAIDVELAAGPSGERRSWIDELLEAVGERVQITAGEAARTAELTAQGLRPLDALHVACAEAGRVDVFLTTDDELLRVAHRPSTRLRVRVANPVTWLQETVQ